MKVYTTDKIRNIVLLGHGGSGKTSLAESMAFLAGQISRPGKVADGNTISDYDAQEQKREMSIQTSMVPILWNDYKINLLDTPGSFDFVGEVEEALTVADAAVIVINGKNGVETGTKRAWDMCERHNLPRMFFVSNMDYDDASLRQVVSQLHDLYGKKIAPFHFSIREDEKFVGYVNVISQTGHRWNDKGEVTECEVPDYNKPYLEEYRTSLIEAVAETNEDLMERYFEGEEFSENEIRQALRVSVADNDIVPISMGSTLLNQGVFTLMDDIIKYLPGPDRCECKGIDAKSNEVFDADYDFAKPKSAYCFKTIVDPFVGKYSLIKVNSGVLKTDDTLYNHHKSSEEKIGKLYCLTGSKAEEVPELHAGDIGALSKLNKVETTDSLSQKDKPVLFIRTGIPTPYTYMRYVVKKKGEEDKAAAALSKIMAEDLTVKVVNDADNRQTLLYGISEQHLEVVVQKVLEKYKVEIELTKPRIAFKETILGTSDVEYKHKKQSGGHGQYGHVKMKFSPSGNTEEAYEFTQSVVGGTVPKNYYPAVEKGIVESIVSGPLAGYPVVGIAIDLYDGSYHPVDSSEQAFKTATVNCFKKGIMEANPILLEPIASMKVICPDDATGDVMGDLNKRRARVNGMNALGNGNTEVNADIPYAELYGYGTALRSMTGGAGDFSYDFLQYQQTSHEVQQAEVARRAAMEEEEEA